MVRHTDDVDDGQDENVDVEEIIHCEQNYIHDDNFLVFQYLIKKKKQVEFINFDYSYVRVAVKP